MPGLSMSQFAQQYAQQTRKSKLPIKNKYGAKKTTIGETTFDSKTEADFYVRLVTMQKGNLIKHLELQPKYLLQEQFVDRHGLTHKPIFYIADFEVLFHDGTIKLYDTKGNKTKEYELKKKLLLHRYRDVIFEEVFAPKEHPITSTILTLEEIKRFKKEAAERSSLWINRFNNTGEKR